MRANELGEAPVTAALATLPGGGTIHAPPDGAALSPSTARATPPWAAGADAGNSTVRPTTTPGPPVAIDVSRIEGTDGDPCLGAGL